MAITALPDTTIHLLGSAQALTTPTSLVKELIDNSLDAKATSIDILISPNTIDKIEVRDNGHGIPQEDLDALGRRGHTSKLRSFEEIKSIGGISLGFRGEALASAVQLGLVSVTTRTEGETVATSVQLKAPGGIASQNRTSHPVGTKVSVTKFLYNLPVRRQTAQKDSAKTLKKIKELLYSYAFARPRVRFCLKVTSGGKGSWSFTPRPNDGMREAASQIIGRDAAAQCIEKSMTFFEKVSPHDSSQERDMSISAQESHPVDSGSDGFTVNVLIPQPKATSIGHGQYISVDSRPVSHDKGTMRKIVSIYKLYVKGSVQEGGEKLKDPFLWLNINCPVSSYDPNVEPAKDDVIFQNEFHVLESVEQLFKNVYGMPASSSRPGMTERVDADPDNFELLMSRPKATEEQISSREHANLIVEPSNPLSRKNLTQDMTSNVVALLVSPTEDFAEAERIEGRSWGVDMSKDFSEEVEDSQWPSRLSQGSRQATERSSDIPARTGNSLNPWIISKMNAPVRPKDSPISLPMDFTLPDSTALLPKKTCLPTPQHSSDPAIADAESRLETAKPRQTANRCDNRSFHPSPVSSQLDQPHREPGDAHCTTTSERRQAMSDSNGGLLLGDDLEASRPSNEFNTARDILNGPMQTLTQHNGLKKSKGLNKPFAALTRIARNDFPQEGLQQTKLTRGVIYSSSAQDNCAPVSQDFGQNDELAWAMDFERRKEDATRQRRKEILAARSQAETDISVSVIKWRQPQLHGEALEVDHTRDATKPSPHKNRYHAALASLEAGQKAPAGNDVVEPSFKTILPDGDPRAYLMRRRKSMQPLVPGGPRRPMRAKSTRLPLEKIPETEKLHMLVLRCSVDMSVIENAFDEYKIHDVYIQKGGLSAGLSMRSSDAKLIAVRTQAVVEKWMEKYPGKAYEAEYSFDSLVDIC